MRVLHVINHLGYGGAEWLLYNFTLHVQKYYPEVDIEVCCLLEEGMLGGQLRQKGIIIHNLNSKKWDIIHAVKRLYKIIKAGRYDIVHVHLFPSLYYTWVVSLFFDSPRYVYTEHSTNNRRRKIPFLNIFEHLIYGRYDKIVANSIETKYSLSSWIKLGDKISVIENGVPIPAIQKKNYKITGVPKLLFIGRLAPAKGVDIAIEAVRILLKKGMQVELTIVGDGPERQRLEKVAEGLPVKFVGFQEMTEIYMANHDILMIPSRWEGFGLTAVEGLMVGIPIIAASVDFLKNNLKDRAHVLFFKKGDRRDLANKAKELLSNQELRAKLAQNGRKLVIERWSIDKFTRETIRLYQNLHK